MRYALYFILGCYLINFFFLAFLIGPFDYDHLSGYWEIAYRFWKTHQGSPQFNPYLCGGRTLGGDPQIPIFHPFLFLLPVLGPTVLIKWEMLGQLALGICGLRGMLKHLKVSDPGKAWAVFLYAAGGGAIAKFLVGHVTLGFYFLYPLFFYLSYHLQIWQGTRSRLILFLYWLLFIYCGMYKPNFVVYGLLPLLIEVTVRSVLKRNLRPLFYFGMGSLLCGLLNASHYLPSWKYFADFPRTEGAFPYSVPFFTLLANLLLPLKSIPKAWYGEQGFLQRHEYNVFLGPVALFFVFRFFKTKQNWNAEWVSLALFVLLSAILGLGTSQTEFSLFSPYTWARTIWPGFQTIRVPTRFWYGVYLGLILFSAASFSWPQKRKFQLLVFTLGMLPLLIMASVNLFKTSVFATHTQFSPNRSFPSEFSWVPGSLSRDDSFTELRRGVGVLECVENLENFRCRSLTEGPLLKSSTPLDSWKTHWENWSSFSISAHSKSATQLSLNLNHSPYWHFQGTGAHIISQNGEPLTFQIEKGPVAGHVKFIQPLEKEGLWISAVAAFCYLAFGWFWAVRPWKHSRRAKNDLA